MKICDRMFHSRSPLNQNNTLKLLSEFDFLKQNEEGGIPINI